MKRIQLIPLILLLWCSGVSLSSGLYFYEIKGSIYLIPISLMTVLYYFLRFLFREFKRKDAICFGITFVISLIGMRMFRDIVIPGLCELYNEISDKVYLSYGLNIGQWVGEGPGSVGLAICQLIAMITVLSLYLYETHRPTVVTALPSFLMFIVSIIADGVPYELCLILYAGALIVFLGVGRQGQSMRIFALLTSCTVIVAVAASVCVPWSTIEEQMKECRERLSEGDMFQSAKAGEDSKRKQRINFGQFNREGNITYTGTVELYVTSRKDFEKEQLYLWHFTGVSYRENNWYDDVAGERFNNVFPVEEGIELQSAYDTEDYYPYAIEPGEFEEFMKQRGGISSDNITPYIKEALRVNDNLRRRIEREILHGKNTVRTIGDAVNIVKNYFSDGFQYTLQPGALVKGMDEVERFLLTTKRGYCTHFASGAVMMFRTLGIPARIAQGYVVAGERLEKDKQVSVYDNNAHAWVEIYVDDRGWIPLDVTSYIWNEAGEEWNYEEDGPNREPVRTPKPQPGEEEEEAEEEEEEEDEETPEAGNGREDADGREVRRAKEPEPEEIMWMFSQYGIVILGIGLVIVCGFSLYRRRQYIRLRKAVHTGSYGERLLVINDGLKPFWRELGTEWDYLDSTVRSEDIFWQTRKYYVMGTHTEMNAVKERIRRYVLSVYGSRYGKEGVSEGEFETSLLYLYDLFDNIKKRVDKKRWKRFCKCSMVRLLEEMRLEDEHERT